MRDKYKVGDLVYVTLAGHEFLARNRTDQFNVHTYGRLAKVAEVYDWTTARGKDILKKRDEHLTWQKLDSKAFKYVLLIYAPDLDHPDTGKEGVAFHELFPLNHPMHDDPLPLFKKWDTTFLLDAFNDCSYLDLIPMKDGKPAKPKPKSKPRKVKKTTRITVSGGKRVSG